MEKKLEAFLWTGLSVLLTLVVYRLIFKPMLPAGITAAIGV